MTIARGLGGNLSPTSRQNMLRRKPRTCCDASYVAAIMCEGAIEAERVSIEPDDHAERLGELAPLGDEPRPQFVPCRKDCAPDPSKLRPPALPWEHCSP